jgi:hypothetical protein
LDELIRTSKSYKKQIIDDPQGQHGLTWSVVERGVMFVKIDDDVIFIGNSTIKDMVEAKVAHPEKLLISANVVNNPAMSWVHYHLMGAIRPYLPELFDRRTISKFPGAPQSYLCGEIANILIIVSVSIPRLTTTDGYLWDRDTHSTAHP